MRKQSDELIVQSQISYFPLSITKMKKLVACIACLTIALSLNPSIANAQRGNRSLWNAFVKEASRQFGPQITRTILDSLFGSSAKAEVARKSQRPIICAVTDPTGTPLNVRATPNDPAVLAKLPNGGRVTPYRIGYDEKNRYWVLVGDSKRPWGWVFRNYVSCSLDS
ncbi:SH3 domain-containing protein [Leptolyngbyaceae cyanobacterium UHCC 1019]